MFASGLKVCSTTWNGRSKVSTGDALRPIESPGSKDARGPSQWGARVSSAELIGGVELGCFQAHVIGGTSRLFSSHSNFSRIVSLH